MFKKSLVLLAVFVMAFAFFACKRAPVIKTISGKIELLTVVPSVPPSRPGNARKEVAVVQNDGKIVFLWITGDNRLVFYANEGKDVTLTGEIKKKAMYYNSKKYDLLFVRPGTTYSIAGSTTTTATDSVSQVILNMKKNQKSK